MISLINPFTGTETMVTDERLDEYIGAGYKLASVPSEQKPIEPVKEVKEEPKKVEEPKKTVKKATAATRNRKK